MPPNEPQRNHPADPTPDPRARAIPVFVSWAHHHAGIEPEAWQESVFRLAITLRRFGIASDIDLAHLHDDDVDWSTFGNQAIARAHYVLLVASSAYKERWEGTGNPKAGPGAAREANTLKALFDDDRDAFRRKVKVVLLPGVDVSDIPTELQSFAQRFTIRTLDLAGLTDLLRTLAGKKKWVMPPVGELPDLPAKFLDGIEARNESELELDHSAGNTSQPVAEQLGTRLERLDREIDTAKDEEVRDELTMERASIHGALKSLGSEAPAASEASVDPGHESATEPRRQFIDGSKTAARSPVLRLWRWLVLPALLAIGLAAYLVFHDDGGHTHRTNTSSGTGASPTPPRPKTSPTDQTQQPETQAERHQRHLNDSLAKFARSALGIERCASAHAPARSQAEVVCGVHGDRIVLTRLASRQATHEYMRQRFDNSTGLSHDAGRCTTSPDALIGTWTDASGRYQGDFGMRRSGNDAVLLWSYARHNVAVRATRDIDAARALCSIWYQNSGDVP